MQRHEQLPMLRLVSGVQISLYKNVLHFMSRTNVLITGDISGSHGGKYEHDYWNVAPCSFVEMVYQVLTVGCGTM
jgi:hypothetical protein